MICNYVIPAWDLGEKLNIVVTEFDYMPAKERSKDKVTIKTGYVVEPGHNFRNFINYLEPRVLQMFKEG